MSVNPFVSLTIVAQNTAPIPDIPPKMKNKLAGPIMLGYIRIGHVNDKMRTSAYKVNKQKPRPASTVVSAA